VKAGGRERRSAALDWMIDGETTHPVPEVLSGDREMQKAASSSEVTHQHPIASGSLQPGVRGTPSTSVDG
jgi:hypothetical protein